MVLQDSSNGMHGGLFRAGAGTIDAHVLHVVVVTVIGRHQSTGPHVPDLVVVEEVLVPVVTRRVDVGCLLEEALIEALALMLLGDGVAEPLGR